MSRKVTARTKLGLAIRDTGKPAYVVAAETGIAFTQLSRYVNAHEHIRPHHLYRLAEYFDRHPDDLVGLVGT